MGQDKIEVLLGNKIGLDADRIGVRKIARVIEKRRLACGLSDVESYSQQLHSSPQELEELIEEIIVPETWFFRDRAAFNFLHHFVQSEWLQSLPSHPLRVLSIPCSTGEEPYSIAITLLEAGLSPSKFSIDAVDISKKSLEKAKLGLYGDNSFRGKEGQEKERYFTFTAKGYQLSDSIRHSVNFNYGNILNPFFLNFKSYNIIFCRNLLIYLDTEARSRTLDILDRLLLPKGLFFVGSAEAALLRREGFVSVRRPFTFAFQKVKTSSTSETILTPNKASSLGKLPQETTRKNTFQLPQTSFPKVQPETNPKKKTEDFPSSPLLDSSLNQPRKKETSTQVADLKTIRRIADSGKLLEAEKLCYSYLEKFSTSADAYVLLGEIYQALNKTEEAEKCFQKAVYLKSDYYEALVHLALLKESQGDLEKAEIIRHRIQRLFKS